MKLTNSQVLQNLDHKLAHLESSKKKQMSELIHTYRDVFPDVPRRTNVMYHDVDVGDVMPIKRHPYHVNPEKDKKITQEIEYMLENNIIQPSRSNWSSPCVVVPKSDQSIRFCTDYRKVNTITKTDVYSIPRIDDYVDRIGNCKFLTKIDFLKGNGVFL